MGYVHRYLIGQSPSDNSYRYRPTADFTVGRFVPSPNPDYLLRMQPMESLSTIRCWLERYIRCSNAIWLNGTFQPSKARTIVFEHSTIPQDTHLLASCQRSRSPPLHRRVFHHAKRLSSFQKAPTTFTSTQLSRSRSSPSLIDT